MCFEHWVIMFMWLRDPIGSPSWYGGQALGSAGVPRRRLCVPHLQWESMSLPPSMNNQAGNGLLCAFLGAKKIRWKYKGKLKSQEKSGRMYQLWFCFSRRNVKSSHVSFHLSFVAGPASSSSPSMPSHFSLCSCKEAWIICFCMS